MIGDTPKNSIMLRKMIGQCPLTITRPNCGNNPYAIGPTRCVTADNIVNDRLYAQLQLRNEE